MYLRTRVNECLRSKSDLHMVRTYALACFMLHAQLSSPHEFDTTISRKEMADQIRVLPGLQASILNNISKTQNFNRNELTSGQ